MGRIIVRVEEIDRRPDRLIREVIGLREMLGEVGRRVGLRAVIPVEVGRAEILGEIREEEIDRLGIQVEIVREGTQEARRVEIPGIVLEILVVLRLAILEGIVHRGMREGVDLQAITRGLHGILMRDFRREAIARRGNHDRSHSHNKGHNLSLSSDLSRGRRPRALDRAGSAGITMPEQRGRRVIAEEPVPAVVVATEEVGTNEIARVDVWVDRRGIGGFWVGSFAGAECGSEDVS